MCTGDRPPYGNQFCRFVCTAALARGGFLDCDCDCGDCDCGGGHGCGGELGEACTDCVSGHPRCKPGICCDIFCHDACEKDPERSKEEQSDESSDPIIGCTGVTETLLAPYGTVIVDGQEHPAKAEFGSIEAGQPVVVVDKQAFGLIVRAVTDEPT